MGESGEEGGKREGTGAIGEGGREGGRKARREGERRRKRLIRGIFQSSCSIISVTGTPAPRSVTEIVWTYYVPMQVLYMSNALTI